MRPLTSLISLFCLAPTACDATVRATGSTAAPDVTTTTTDAEVFGAELASGIVGLI